MPDVTLVVTSCDRHDLLERTLLSFNRFNSYPIKRTVIVEDSNLSSPEWLQSLDLGEKIWITNGKRKGQIYSVDRAYAEVETPYIFHCEDDWEFFHEGFIEKSLDILERYPNILQCSLRDDWQHPSVTLPDFPFPVNQPDWQGGWSGFAFNPGLRRLKDYRRIGSYGREVGYDPSFVGELHLSKLYRSMGFYAAALPAHCKHIGEGKRHVAWETAPKVPKVLIAIPVCHKYDYGLHCDDKIDHTNKVSNARIDAVRATWAKYVPAFKSYVDFKFFYGRKRDRDTREPLADEVFLDVRDDYDSLPHKVKAIYQWALDHKYEYVYKGDDDSFAYLDRLMASGFEDHHYIGYTTADPNHPLKERYASGGSGYCIDKVGMEILVKSDIGQYWAEDWWVGNTLLKHGIAVTRDARYLPGFDKHYVDLKKLPNPHNYITFHACTPEMMKQLYEANPSPTFKLVTHALGESPSFTGKCELNFVAKERVENVGTVKRLHNGLRILIAILSCHHRKALPQAQRETWLKDIRKYPIDYKYFLGNLPPNEAFDPRRAASNQVQGSQLLPDEVMLDAPDDYDSLCIKTKALLEWAYECGYDFVFKCDQDTYCHIERLLASGFEQYPYSGHRRVSEYFGPKIEYGQGGGGYWIDRERMKLVIAEDAVRLRGGPEDINVARILGQHGIKVKHDFRYQPAMAWPLAPDNDMITAHQCTVEEMYEIHSRFCKEPSLNQPDAATARSGMALGMERVQACETQG